MTLAATGHFGLKAQGYISLPAGWLACSLSVSGTASASVATTSPDANGLCWIEGHLGRLEANIKAFLKALGGTFECEIFEASHIIWDGVPIGPYETGCICY
jgi:hypothetical protein